MSRRLVGLVAVLGMSLGGCLWVEQPLTVRFTCFELAEDQSFGQARELDVDVQLFSRPGRYEPLEVRLVLEPLGVDTEAEHVARITGPCGETDVFVRVADGEHCITLVAHAWWDHVCRAFDGPTVFPLDLGEMDGHGVLVVVGPNVDHVRADSAGFVLGGFPIEGHVVLTSPHPLENPRRVAFDGAVTDP